MNKPKEEEAYELLEPGRTGSLETFAPAWRRNWRMVHDCNPGKALVASLPGCPGLRRCSHTRSPGRRESKSHRGYDPGHLAQGGGRPPAGVHCQGDLQKRKVFERFQARGHE